MATFESRFTAMMKSFAKKQIGTCVGVAATSLQHMVRIEAADARGIITCCSCGTTQHYKRADGGHFIPRGHWATVLDERNVNPQCKYCNRFPTADTLIRYTAWMVKTYGQDVVDELQRLKKTHRKWTKEELVYERIGFIDRIKAAEQRLQDVS